MSDKDDFVNAVKDAYLQAKHEAETVDGGDPGTMVSFSVHGNRQFANRMKKFGEQNGSVYKLAEKPQVKMDSDGYSLHLNDLLEGTDMQLHSKKIAAHREFARVLEEKHGYSVGLDKNMYSY